MLITPSFKKSLIVEQFQGNYLNLIEQFKIPETGIKNNWSSKLYHFILFGSDSGAKEATTFLQFLYVLTVLTCAGSLGYTTAITTEIPFIY